MAYNMGGRRFRPVGSGKKRTAPQYGPVGTGCPFVEEAVARLYREQNEEHFWSLMNALNYALELQTKVLVPLDAAVDPQSGAAPWAHLPIPEERAEGLQPWLLHTRKERNYLPLFTSVKNAEAEKASATRPMVERSLRSAMEYALETDGIRFKEGIDIGEERPTKPAELVIKKSGSVSEIELTITEGKFHQVKRMFEALGKRVIYLKRISMGPLKLPDDLKTGAYRALTQAETDMLMQIKSGK